MLRNFQELFEKAKARGTIRVAVAAAQDLEVIEAIQAGIQAGLIEAILVGEGAIIGPMSEGMGISAHVRIIHEPDMAAASLLAAGLVREGEAQVLMTGLVNSAIFLRGALDANRGLRTGRLLSHLVALEIPGEKKLAFYTDGGMNIEPGFEEKKLILENALGALAQMGVETPKVAILCANEQVNPKMQATVDAKALVDAWEAGTFGDCIVEGPIAMDVALSPQAAHHKGIKSRISGDVDLYLMPNIESGNMTTKAILHYTRTKFAGVILGAARPIVMVSRSDTAEAKLNAIAMAALM